MNIDYLIESERKKIRELISVLDFEKGKKQIEKYGFYTVSINHKNNLPQGEMSIVLHENPDSLSNPNFHNHDYYEMVYVYRGSCHNAFSDQEMVLDQGDILLMNPYSIHYIYTPHEDDCVFNIMLSRTLFEKTLFSMLQSNKLLSNFIINYMYQINTSQDYLYFPKQENGQTDDIITNLIYEFLTFPVNGNHGIVTLLLMTLLSTLARSFADERLTTSVETVKSFPLPEIIHFINQNCTTVTLSTLEKKFSYSTAYISRAIKKHCHQNFSQLVQNAKLQLAHDMLRYSKTSIEDIAISSGFHDISYFNKLFRQKYSLSPKDYQKLYRL